MYNTVKNLNQDTEYRLCIMMSHCACAVQVMRHGVGLSTSSDSELITQLLALVPHMEEQDSPDWVAKWVLCCNSECMKYSFSLLLKRLRSVDLKI